MAFNTTSTFGVQDPTFGAFGDIFRSIGLPEFGISEFFGGKTGSQTGDPEGVSLSNTAGTLFEGLSGTGGEATIGPFNIPGAGDTGSTTVSTGEVIGTSDGGSQVQISTGTDSEGRETFIDPISGEERTKKTDEGAIAAAQAEEEARLAAEVESVFSSGEGLLDSAEANLRASEGDLQTSATAPFDAATATATANIAEGTAAFGSGIAEAGQSEQTLLASARRLYDELQRRNRQQFGGTALSSAAQGASELGARALQQGLGNIQTTTQNAINTLKENLINFENGAAAKLQELAFMKDKAIADANIAFRDALQAIDAQRATLASNKAIAKLDALRSYRDQLFNVQSQATSFEQQIELMREQARLNVGNTLSQIGAASDKATSSSQDINALLTSSGAAGAAAQHAGSQIGPDQSSSLPLVSGRVGEEDRNIGGSLLSLA